MKDPAFLFYSSDFLSGTLLMSDEDVGKYIRLLCLQHQKGHLKEKDMLSICKTFNEEVFNKFTKDNEGNYYNERLEYESNKRKAYSESRRNNRKKKEENKTYEEDMKNICNTYEKHMGNENENIIINKNININKKDNRVIGEEEKKDTAKASKHKYGEYKNVLLKDEELQTLQKKYTNWQDLITYLDEYIEMKGYKAKSHYLAINKWVVEAVNQKNKKTKSNKLIGRDYTNFDFNKLYANGE